MGLWPVSSCSFWNFRLPCVLAASLAAPSCPPLTPPYPWSLRKSSLVRAWGHFCSDRLPLGISSWVQRPSTAKYTRAVSLSQTAEFWFTFRVQRHLTFTPNLSLHYNTLFLSLPHPCPQQVKWSQGRAHHYSISNPKVAAEHKSKFLWLAPPNLPTVSYLQLVTFIFVLTLLQPRWLSHWP